MRVGVEFDEAESLLADGWGWKKWARASDFMKKYADPFPPDAGTLRASLDWLSGGPLGLEPEQLRRMIRALPRVYLLDPEGTYGMAVGSAPEEYSCDPLFFRDMILSDPSVMDFTYNCKVGDDGCASECGNCWVTYENR